MDKGSLFVATVVTVSKENAIEDSCSMLNVNSHLVHSGKDF